MILDREKIKWLLERRLELSFFDDRAVEYWLEIEELLSQDMHETMSFMEECSNEELNLLSEELFDICQKFESGNGEGEFINFVRDLAARRPKCKTFSGELVLVIESLKEAVIDKTMDTIEKVIKEKGYHDMFIRIASNDTTPKEASELIYSTFTGCEKQNNNDKKNILIKVSDMDQLSLFIHKLKSLKLHFELTKNLITIY